MLPEPPAAATRPSSTRRRASGARPDRDNKGLFDAHEEWETQVEEGRTKADELNARFADWYYVIAAEDFEKLRVTRKDLLRAKAS